LVLTAALLMAAMLVAAGPAFASHVTEHPFCGSGEQYAQEHITVIAQNEPPGLTGPPRLKKLIRQRNMLRESTSDSLYATRPDMPEVSSY
jgi:hypothetical protein